MRRNCSLFSSLVKRILKLLVLAWRRSLALMAASARKARRLKFLFDLFISRLLRRQMLNSLGKKGVYYISSKSFCTSHGYASCVLPRNFTTDISSLSLPKTRKLNFMDTHQTMQMTIKCHFMAPVSSLSWPHRRPRASASSLGDSLVISTLHLWRDVSGTVTLGWLFYYLFIY